SRQEMITAHFKVSADLTRALVIEDDRLILLFDLKSGGLISSFGGDVYMPSVEFSPDGNFIAMTVSARNTEIEHGEVWLLDSHTGAVILASDAPEARPNMNTYSITFSAVGP